MIDDESAKELRDAIHNLLRRVSMARLNAMLEPNLELRMGIAADILDEVERELARMETL